MISDIYVGDDGKLHKVQSGADSVLPFSGGGVCLPVLEANSYNGTYGYTKPTFNVSDYSTLSFDSYTGNCTTHYCNIFGIKSDGSTSSIFSSSTNCGNKSFNISLYETVRFEMAATVGGAKLTNLEIK